MLGTQEIRDPPSIVKPPFNANGRVKRAPDTSQTRSVTGAATAEITRFIKDDGPLTKHIRLENDKVVSDGSACLMVRGEARRQPVESIADLANLIGSLGSHEAIALGALREDLPDTVNIITKTHLNKLNGSTPPNTVARTGENIVFRAEQPAFALLDFDQKGMPATVATKLDELGGFGNALLTVVPELASAARLVRSSTSAGLYRADTEERFVGSGGLHVYVQIKDGDDCGRFLKALHRRCWLAGLGWIFLGAAGQMIERSLVDYTVGQPERLVFEGAPKLEQPLEQDLSQRKPSIYEGDILDTRDCCPDLSAVEMSQFNRLLAIAKQRLTPDAEKIRATFVKHQAEKIAKEADIPFAQAKVVAEKLTRGILCPSLALPFDDAELEGKTVADVLADPAAFVDVTLSDPIEGVSYGRCKAKIMIGADGIPFIHSFAHGGAAYHLRYDTSAAKAQLESQSGAEAAKSFIELVIAGTLDETEIEILREIAATRSGTGKRTLDRALKKAQAEQAERIAEAERRRKIAERRDPRPQIPAPLPDAEWLPQIDIMNEVLGKSSALEPPMRDDEGFVTAVRVRGIPSMHLLTAAGANADEPEETRLPAPDQPMLVRLSEDEVAEVIERNIEYVTETREGYLRSVHIAPSFVKHFCKRSDDCLPVVRAIATMPIVLSDGSVLAGCGLDRERDVVFRIPREILALVPRIEECDNAAVAGAMCFLCDEWLVDVATSYVGKCTLIALALTIMERLALDVRPAFNITAARRGGGKTTALHMISMAVLGYSTAAAAWSSSEDERRKALFAYLGSALALIAWDNIPRGTLISCPSIEKALTAATYQDRVLGASEQRIVPAYTVQAFTGNNIGARGDLRSRTLDIRIDVNSLEPENRQFHHPDPIGWTEAHRGKILQSLFTILLGNPRLRGEDDRQAPTRFKQWWHLVGSAVEHAGRIAAMENDPFADPPVSFEEIFRAGDEDEEQDNGLATALSVIKNKWPNGTDAATIAKFINDKIKDPSDPYSGSYIINPEGVALKDAIESAAAKPMPIVTSTIVAWRLKAIVGAPADVGNGKDQLLALQYTPDKRGGIFAVAAVK